MQFLFLCLIANFMKSEFRKDIVSGDWVIISSKRGKRPDQFKTKIKRKIVPKNNCPFEDPQKAGNGNPILIYPDKKNWIVQVIPNRFPAVKHQKICPIPEEKGPYAVMDANGFHDLVITRDHYKNFPHLDKAAANLLFKTFKDRYLMFNEHECLEYIFIFANWGPKAGASIFHPHYQIISLPIIPPDVSRSLSGSLRYYQDNNRCVHCAMIEYEMKEKKRIVYENEEAIAFAPFVSREPFELRVFPKKHQPFFEETEDNIMKHVVDALQQSLLKLEKHLNDPDYNFFIHTAPLIDKKMHFHYHWHIEVVPKFQVSAGVEVGTGIEITIVDPDEAAKILRKK